MTTAHYWLHESREFWNVRTECCGAGCAATQARAVPCAGAAGPRSPNGYPIREGRNHRGGTMIFTEVERNFYCLAPIGGGDHCARPRDHIDGCGRDLHVYDAVAFQVCARRGPG